MLKRMVSTAKKIDWKIIIDAEIGREKQEKALNHKVRIKHKERK